MLSLAGICGSIVHPIVRTVDARHCRLGISDYERPACCKEHPMWDLIMLAIGLGFFALAVAYAYGCNRL
jgi:hypothetical protein